MTFKINITSTSKHDNTSNAHMTDRAQEEDGAQKNCSYSTLIKGRRAVEEAPFPVKLFKVLELIDAHEPELAVIMSWQPHGSCFCIHDPEKFQDTIIPRFFFENETYSSFLFQLKLWGFKSLNLTGPFSGGYYHELFRRECPFLCRGITRTAISSEGRSRAGNAREESRIMRKDYAVNTYVNRGVTHVPPKRQTSCFPASSTNVICLDTPRHQQMRSALHLEDFNTIPSRRLRKSPRPREHGNSRSLRDSAKRQSSTKVFRGRMCSTAAEDANSRIARPKSRKQESSRSLVGREEVRAVRKKRNRSAGALTRSCASVADEESSRISRPRSREQESSTSLGGRVKSQTYTDAFRRRRRRRRSAGALARSCASVADEESSRISRPRSRKQESSTSLVGREEVRAVRKRKSRSAGALTRSCASVADEESSRISRISRSRKQQSSRSLGVRVKSQPATDAMRRRRSRSAGALARSCTSVSDEESSRMSRPRSRKQESSTSLGDRVKSLSSTDASRRRRSISPGALTRSCTSVADEESSRISRPIKQDSSRSLVGREEDRAFRKRRSRSACVLTRSYASVTNEETSLVSRYRSRKQESSTSLGGFSTKAFRRRSRPAGALTRSRASVADEESSRISRPRSREQESITSLGGREEGKVVRKRRSRSAGALARSFTSVADEENSRISRPRPRRQESTRFPDDREEGRTKKARRRRRRPSGALTRSYSGLSDRYLNSIFHLVDYDSSSSGYSFSKIQSPRRRGEKIMRHKVGKNTASCDMSDRSLSISNDLTTNVSDFRYKLDRTMHRINFIPSSRNILDRIVSESGKSILGSKSSKSMKKNWQLSNGKPCEDQGHESLNHLGPSSKDSSCASFSSVSLTKEANERALLNRSFLAIEKLQNQLEKLDFSNTFTEYNE